MFEIICVVVLLLILTGCACRFLMPSHTIYWFYSKTCGHCIRMESDWEKFTTMCPANIKVEKINIVENQPMARAYGVNGVPYIVREEYGRRYVYEGDRTAQDLYNFATATL